MTEFITCKGEFLNWTDKARAKPLESLLRIILDTVVCNFGSTVFLDDWNTVNQEYELAENDFYPYALAGWSCTQRTLGWCDGHGYKYPLFIFEHGDKHQFHMLRRVEKDFGIIARTALKKPNKKKPNEVPLVQLQSADFAAWQILNLMRGYQAGLRAKTEMMAALGPVLWGVFARLFGPLPYEHRHFSLESHSVRGPSLIRLCKEYNVPRRAIDSTN
jgi:hypothetical protein